MRDAQYFMTRDTSFRKSLARLNKIKSLKQIGLDNCFGTDQLDYIIFEQGTIFDFLKEAIDTQTFTIHANNIIDWFDFENDNNPFEYKRLEKQMYDYLFPENVEYEKTPIGILNNYLGLKQ
jgi:hypothetical protein